jgi:hypothetical protein
MQIEITHNATCNSELHEQHLCYVMSQGFHLSDKECFKAIIDKPLYKCAHCGRRAHKAENLCEPVEL